MNLIIFILALPSFSTVIAQRYICSTIVGDGRGWSRDGFANYGAVPIANASGLWTTNAVWIDQNRSKLFITEDWGNRVRAFDLKTNFLSTLSGTGYSDFLNGNGNEAKWWHPVGIVMDSFGNLYVSEWDNCCIRKVTQSGLTSTFSGICRSCGFADGNSRTAQFQYPGLMTIDNNNVIYVADSGNHRIRKLLTDGSVTTYAGGSSWGNIDGPLLNARFNRPYDVQLDKYTGDLFVADKENHLIRKISLQSVSIYAGSYFGHADGPWYQAKFSYPSGLAIDNEGNLFVSDSGNKVIRKIDTARDVTTISGTILSSYPIRGIADGILSESLYAEPRGINIDSNGILYISDWGSHTIRTVYPENLCETGLALCAGQGFKCRTGLCVERLTGTGHKSFRDGDRLTAAFNQPSGLAYDRNTGILYIVDRGGHTIRKLTPDGSISTHAGDGNPGFINGPGSSARFQQPYGITVSAAGIIYVSDMGNHCIRTIASDTTVTTLAGVCQNPGVIDGAWNVAKFTYPAGLTLDETDTNLFIAGYSDGRIRKVVISSGNVSTFAGGDMMGSADGQGMLGKFNWPLDVAFNSSGYLFVADTDNHLIRTISPTGYVSTFAGSSAGLEDGQGTAAMFNRPMSLVFDNMGSLFVSDNVNQVIRKISPSGSVTTIVNSKRLRGTQQGPALNATFASTVGIEVNVNGTIYVADDGFHQIFIICDIGLTCINGRVDCFNLRCQCDDGWNGPTCADLLSNITTTATTSKTETTSASTITSPFTNMTSTFITTSTSTASTSTTPFTNMTSTLITTSTSTASTSTTPCTNFTSTSTSISTSATSSLTTPPTTTTSTRAYSTTNMIVTLVISSSSPNTSKSSTTTNLHSSIPLSQEDTRTFFTSSSSLLSSGLLSEQAATLSMTTIVTVSVGGVLLIIASTMILTMYLTRRKYKRSNVLYSSSKKVLKSNLILNQPLSPKNQPSSPIEMYNQPFFPYMQPSSPIEMYNQPFSPYTQPSSPIETYNPPISPYIQPSFPIDIYNKRNSYGIIPNNLYLGNTKIGESGINPITGIRSNSIQLSNSITRDSTQRLTQNVSTAPLFIPGYNDLKLGIDFIVPDALENIGNGGTASIFRGTLINPILIDKHKVVNIAVKVFPPKNDNDTTTTYGNESFLYEVAIMNMIPANPHVVKFIGFTQTTQCAIIMKQYEGSLYGMIKDKVVAIDPIICCKVARDVSVGLRHIHGMNILHLDVKPHNILWERRQDGNFNFCICDFGFASIVGESRKIVSGLQIPKSVGITVRYTAPEVFVRLALPVNNGRVNNDLDKKIDVYAFALTMYEMMLGGSFWKELEYREIIDKVQSGERPSIEVLPAEITGNTECKNLIHVVLAGWKQNPLERPTFAEIYNMLL